MVFFNSQWGVTAAAGASSTATWSLADVATSTSNTIVVPAGAAVNDWMVLVDQASANSVPTAVTPTGFTSISNTSGTVRHRSMVTYKKIVLADLGATITGMNGGSSNSKVLWVFRPTIDVSAITIASLNAIGAAAADPSAQVVTASGATKQPVVIAAYACNGNGTLGTVSFSPTENGSQSPAATRVVKYRIGNNDVTVDMTAPSADDMTMISFYFQET